MAWLKAITAPNLDVAFEHGRHYAAVQEMTEEFRKEITYQGAFRYRGPALRRIRNADEATFNFQAILLEAGAGEDFNSEEGLMNLGEDFDVHVQRGPRTVTYKNCNWSRIAIRSTLDQVLLDCDISIPGYDGKRVGTANKAAA